MMVKRFVKDSVILGLVKKTKLADGKFTYKRPPKRKFRVIVQERNVVDSKREAMSSFMIYDFSGRVTVASIKRRTKNCLEKKGDGS